MAWGLCLLWALPSLFGVGWGGGGSAVTCLLSAGAERALVARPSLESLLAAGSHMLREVLDGPVVDPLKNLRLPRELKPNKKYSWMRKKEERVSGRLLPPWGSRAEAGWESPLWRCPSARGVAGFGAREG